MTTQPKDVAKLAQLLHDVVALAGEPAPPAPVIDEDFVKSVVRSVLAENAVDTAPYSYTVESAMDATGLSETRIRSLIREDVIATRQEGVKLIIVGTSLRKYIDSLPAREQKWRGRK